MNVWRYGAAVLGLTLLLATPQARADGVLQESIGLAGPAWSW